MKSGLSLSVRSKLNTRSTSRDSDDESNRSPERISIDGVVSSGLVLSRSLDDGSTEDEFSRMPSRIIPLDEVHDDQFDKPLLLRNRMDGLESLSDEQSKFKFDISQRPEQVEVSSSTYQEMPVADFGKAMLLGMGWKPGAPIGRSNPAAVKPVEVKQRPSLLGLGAMPPQIEPQLLGDRKKKSKSQIEIEQQYVKDMKAKQIKSESIVASKKSELWLRRNAVVKCISKSFQNGSLYGKKGRILSVNPMDRSAEVVLLASAMIYPKIPQRCLETVIPAEGEQVIIVRGEHSGSIGRLQSKDRSQYRVKVLLENETSEQTYDYDDVAQYLRE